MKFSSLCIMMIFLQLNVYSDNSIDAQIEEIMNADNTQRYKLMNELKRKLATMNQKERNEALQKLSGNKTLNTQGTTVIQQPTMFMKSTNTNKSLYNSFKSAASKGKQ